MGVYNGEPKTILIICNFQSLVNHEYGDRSFSFPEN